MKYFYCSIEEQQTTIDITLRDFGVLLSVNFLTCAEIKLKEFFIARTGILVPHKNIVLSTSIFNLEIGPTSFFSTSIFVNHEYIFIKICWNSKSGRIYKMSDVDIDCNDIQFWMENLDVKLVHQYLNPTFKNPFKLKDLSHELVITNLAINMDIDFTLKDSLPKPGMEVINDINTFIEKYNVKADKSDGEIGAVHNWKVEGKSDGFIYHFDLGLSGMTFLPGLLKYLSKMNCFSKVELR